MLSFKGEWLLLSSRMPWQHFPVSNAAFQCTDETVFTGKKNW